MTENERLFESIAMKGQCPDCNAVALESNGPYVHCKTCHAMFIAQQFYVRRVQSVYTFDHCLTDAEISEIKKKWEDTVLIKEEDDNGNANYGPNRSHQNQMGPG